MTWWFLAVPGTVAGDVAGSIAKELTGKVVVDCNHPLVLEGRPGMDAGGGEFPCRGRGPRPRPVRAW